MSGCRFVGNSAGQIGGAIAAISPLALVNTLIWGNEVNDFGGGIFLAGTASITNCTVVGNRTRGKTSETTAAGIVAWSTIFPVPVPGFPAIDIGFANVQSCIVWDNTGSDDAAEPRELSQLSGRMNVSNSCFNAPDKYRGNGNIGNDRKFQDAAFGDLRLTASSPCIDRGDSFVDVNPFLPGLQFLTDLNLGGLPRVVDGNGDGIPTVDFGAFEAPPHRE